MPMLRPLILSNRSKYTFFILYGDVRPTTAATILPGQISKISHYHTLQQKAALTPMLVNLLAPVNVGF